MSFISSFRHVSFRVKILLLGLVGVGITAAGLLGAVGYQRELIGKRVCLEVNELGNQQCAAIAQNVHTMLAIQDAVVNQKVLSDLSVARGILERAGGIEFDKATVAWSAVNQYDKKVTETSLPKMLVGDQWLGQNSDVAVESPIVDEVRKMVGGTCTIFQRMGKSGEMLRICTNVEKLDGTRAIGTYIPACNPDGAPNPVIETVLQGKTYNGRAFVVNAWYVTAYEPIFDENRQVVGMLYVGVKQESVPQLRQSIMDIVVGKTGYVFVLGGKGEHQGQYIISDNGARDGEDIWQSTDAEGRPFVQSLIKKGIELKPGEVAFERYPWQNEGEAEPRWKVAAISYFEPWDWVIGVGAYEEDFHDALERVDDGLRNLTLWSILGTLAGILVCSCVTWWISGLLTRPLFRTMEVIGKVARGDYSEKVSVKSQDEVGKMAASLNTCIDAIRLAMDEAKVGALRKIPGPSSGHLEPFSSRRKPAPLTKKLPAKDCPVSAHPQNLHNPAPQRRHSPDDSPTDDGNHRSMV